MATEKLAHRNLGTGGLSVSAVGLGCMSLSGAYGKSNDDDGIALIHAALEEGITLLNGVPATYQRLLEYKATAGLPKLDRGALRLIGVAGAPLDPDLKARVEKELGLPLFNAFGITECSPTITLTRRATRALSRTPRSARIAAAITA